MLMSEGALTKELKFKTPDAGEKMFRHYNKYGKKTGQLLSAM
jgi:hypothetical protein